jgi:hypothetical protein
VLAWTSAQPGPGHAHHGTEKGITLGGIRIRNVAKPVIGQSFKVYELPEEVPSGRTVKQVTHTAGPTHSLLFHPVPDTGPRRTPPRRPGVPI